MRAACNELSPMACKQAILRHEHDSRDTKLDLTSACQVNKHVLKGRGLSNLSTYQHLGLRCARAPQGGRILECRLDGRVRCLGTTLNHDTHHCQAASRCHLVHLQLDSWERSLCACKETDVHMLVLIKVKICEHTCSAPSGPPSESACRP
jgi:hypothetical protein